MRSPTRDDDAAGVRWLVDGNNVMGAHPDGWWRDRPAAQLRWARRIGTWARTHGDTVVLLFDGAPRPEVLAESAGSFTVEYAARRGPDAADDRLVALALEGVPGTVVVSADRGLLARLPAGVRQEGPRAFARRLEG